jgi:uncharacterized protein (TIGR00290 family)
MTHTNYPYFVSWSGGKDSCLALQRAIQDYGKPHYLITMLTEEGERSRSHGLKRSILQAQADLLGVTILFYDTSWENYEETFINALQELRAQGIEGGVFGDIKIAYNLDWIAHCEWAQKVCAAANMTAQEPLWNDSEESLIASFLESGIMAKIIAVKNNCVDTSYLGEILTAQIINELIEQGTHPLGETGEFHTLVIDSPLFASPLKVIGQDHVLRDGYWYLDLEQQP